MTNGRKLVKEIFVTEAMIERVSSLLEGIGLSCHQSTAESFLRELISSIPQFSRFHHKCN